MEDPPPPPAPGIESAAHPVDVPLVVTYAPQVLALGIVFGAVVPRVWRPLLDRDAGVGEELLWVVTLPLAALAASLLVSAALAALWRRVALSRAFGADAPSARALHDGGHATLVGVVRGQAAPSPGRDTPCLGWARREPADPPSLVGPRALDRSAAGPFELVCDDGSVVPVRAGPWRVAAPFGPWDVAGEWALVEGERVRVRGRVDESLEPAAGGDYRASGRRRELAPDDGLIAPAGASSRKPEALRRSVPVPWAALAVTAVHAGLRFVDPAPVHTNVAVGRPCDERHVCGLGTYCGGREDGRGLACRRDCARDEDCEEESRCDEDGRCLPVSPFRPGTRTQGESCAHARCAPGHRCVRNIMSIGRDGGMGEVYCAKECQRDEECPRGTWCTVMSSTPAASWCSRLEDIPEVFRVVMRMHRDGALPEPPDAAE